MNTPQEHATVALDAAEDLTLYADEEFDNDDVDLFEFTTVDDHPLATLKSIILSLEWEIDDDILEQLSEEVRHLREEWAGDKIVQLYLQGIDKIGRYIRSEQAYAHPNSIKLLNSYFYNLEQILSNPDLTDDDVVLLLKTDVRKFKILQYQISLTRKDAAIGHKEEDVAEEIKAASYYEHLRNLKALVLGLDWEITDRDLEGFHKELKELKNIYQTEPYTLVLINGLLTIGAYISEQRMKAHPEAFSLLYAFFESLESFLLNDDVSEEKQKEIIVDRVQRLNNLKKLVAGESGDTTEETAPEEDIVEEGEVGEEGPVGELPGVELEFPEEEISFAAEEPEVSAAPAAFFEEDQKPAEAAPILFEEDEVLPEPEAPAKESMSEKGEITFDLSDEIDTHVSSFFDDIDTDESIIYDEDELTVQAKEPAAKKKKITTDTPISSALSHDPLAEIESLDDDAIEAIDEEIVDGKRLVPSISDIESGDQKKKQPVTSLQRDQADEEESGLSLDEVFIPALSDSEESGGFREETYSDEKIEIPQEHIDQKLDSFFGPDSMTESLSEQTPAQTPATEPAEEELIIPALADSSEESGFDDTTLSDEQAEIPQKDIDAKLATFFDIEEEVPAVAPATEKLTQESEEEPVMMALADAEENHGFSEDVTSDEQMEIPQETIDDKLDSFFGNEDEEVPAAPAAEELTLETEEEPVMMALADAEEDHGFSEDVISGEQMEIPQETIDGKLDSFFGIEDEEIPAAPTTEELTLETEEEPVMMALADSEEEHGFSEDVTSGEQMEIPQETIDNKLDSFFETGEEKEILAPVADKKASITTEKGLFTAELAGTEEQSLFEKSSSDAKVIEPPEQSIDDKLDSFFAADEEDSQLIIPQDATTLEEKEVLTADLFEEREDVMTGAPVAESITESFRKQEAETTHPAPVPGAFGKQLNDFIESQKNHTIEKEFEKQFTLFQTIGDQIQQLPESEAKERSSLISECIDLMAQFRKDPLPQTQQPILQLLESVISLLTYQDRTRLPDNTLELISYLYSHVNTDEQDRVGYVILEAIENYTQWQKELFDNLSRSIQAIPSAIEQEDEVLDYKQISSEIRHGLNDLRSTLHREIDALRKEFSSSTR